MKPLTKLDHLSSDELRGYASEFKPRVADPSIEKIGYLIEKTFLEIGLWKSPRTERHYNNESRYNDRSRFIEEVSRASFSACSEQFRIESLQMLCGVGYPVASALLHFGLDSDAYPIIDFRTLWSLSGVDKNDIKYDFELWDKYRNKCLELSDKHSMTLRELDKALWQYCFVKQK